MKKKKEKDEYTKEDEEYQLPHPHNVRTYFECEINETYREIATTPISSGGGGTLPPGNRRIGKRSAELQPNSTVEDIPNAIQLFWTDIQTEWCEDWPLLSLMSATALFMLFIIYRLKKN